MPAKVCMLKAIVFSAVTHTNVSWTIKKAECWRTDAFTLWCWRRLSRVPRMTRRSNQWVLKEINLEYSLEGLMLNLKLQYFGYQMQRPDSLWPHGLQHTKRCCPSLSSRVCSNSCPLGQQCHPTISSAVAPFSSALSLYKHHALRIRWPKYWSFRFSISPSTEYSGLSSFRIYWFNLAVQETLKSFLQSHSLKASVLQHSVYFMVQLSHLYMTTGKTIALTIQTFAGKLMSLLFNTLNRF